MSANLPPAPRGFRVINPIRWGLFVSDASDVEPQVRAMDNEALRLAGLEFVFDPAAEQSLFGGES